MESLDGAGDLVAKVQEAIDNPHTAQVLNKWLRTTRLVRDATALGGPSTEEVESEKVKISEGYDRDPEFFKLYGHPRPLEEEL